MVIVIAAPTAPRFPKTYIFAAGFLMPQPAKGKPRHSAFTNLIFNILAPLQVRFPIGIKGGTSNLDK